MRCLDHGYHGFRERCTLREIRTLEEEVLFINDLRISSALSISARTRGCTHTHTDNRPNLMFLPLEKFARPTLSSQQFCFHIRYKVGRKRVNTGSWQLSIIDIWVEWRWKALARPEGNARERVYLPTVTEVSVDNY